MHAVEHGCPCALSLLMIAASSVEAALTDGLIHYWPLDEVGGVTAHDTVGGNDGLLVNWAAAEPRWVLESKVMHWTSVRIRLVMTTRRHNRRRDRV